MDVPTYPMPANEFVRPPNPSTPVFVLRVARPSNTLPLDSLISESARVEDDAALGNLPVVRPEMPLPPDGVAHVPSPRQKVDDEADVPLLRFATGRLPAMPVERGKPGALVRTRAAGVPRAGVIRVGDEAKTSAPLPVSSVR